MRRIFLIIDGYNLMHAAGYARPTYGPGDLQRCRDRFLKHLQRLLTVEACSLSIVVFDAFNSRDDQQRKTKMGTLQVLYADPELDADTEIERLLKTHSAPGQVLIVSSDHRLHKAARRRRAKCLDSEEFWKSLTREPNVPTAGNRSREMKPAPDASAPAPDSLVTDPEVRRIVDEGRNSGNESYLDEFLQIDVQEIARELKREERRN